MIYCDVVQGGDEWRELRRGIPTSSVFNEIVSPYKLIPLAGSWKLPMKLLVEWSLGLSEENPSQFMQRGSQQEQDAIGYYALEKDCDPVRPGIFLRDDRLVGCSPDLLIGDDGGVEIKVPAAATHLGYLLDDDPKQYACQIQGAMWLTGRQWWDFLSYHPTYPPKLIHFERDDTFIKTLNQIVSDFVGRMLAERERLLKMGVVPVVTAPEKVDLTAALAGVLD